MTINKSVVFVAMLVLLVGKTFADTGTKQGSGEENSNRSNLILTIPEEELENQPGDEPPKQLNQSDETRAERQRCAELSRKIEALRGKLKPARRSALVNEYRAECQNTGAWENESVR